MGHRTSRFPLLALAALLFAACHEQGPPLAPAVRAPPFSAAPGDGPHGAIAFHSNRDGDFDIYVMNADGSNVTQLTHNDVHEFDPIWSPNGQQLAFGRLTCCGAAVILINDDGSGERILTDNGFPQAWSPNGKQITFDRGGEVFLINVDGTGLKQLTHGGGRSTAWSPDGKQIMLQRTVDGNTDLYVMTPDGTGLTRLTDDPASDEGDHSGWSPNSKQIVFSSTRDGGNLHIFVMNADGTGVTQLTSGDFTDDDPVWSPDGKQIAFQSTRDGDEEIYVMNADGSGIVQLTNNSTLPDGTPIFDAVAAWRARPLGK